MLYWFQSIILTRMINQTNKRNCSNNLGMARFWPSISTHCPSENRKSNSSSYQKIRTGREKEWVAWNPTPVQIAGEAAPLLLDLALVLLVLVPCYWYKAGNEWGGVRSSASAGVSRPERENRMSRERRYR
jgi:hypothetical protein